MEARLARGPPLGISEGGRMRRSMITLLLFCLPLSSPVVRRAISRLSPSALFHSWRASWYGPGFDGRLTASGLRFLSALPIIAHRSLPIGTVVRVEHDGRSAYGLVLDRGPFIKGRDMDLSWYLASKLGILKEGVADVTVEVLGRLPRERWNNALSAFS
jgi:rare lipoprotein A (peptidoglycan hydrolase)